MSASVQLGPNFALPITLSEKLTPIYEALKKINSTYRFTNKHDLSMQLGQLSHIEMNELLIYYFQNILEETGLTNPEAFISRLAEVVPYEKLELILQRENDSCTLLKKAKNMFKSAKLALEIENGHSQEFKELGRTLFDSAIAVLEGIINAFGIASFFKPAENAMQADFKSHRLMMLLSLFSMMMTLLIPLVGAVTASQIVGGAFLGISALSLAWPYIKPRTTTLPHAENLSESKNQIGVSGRELDVADIASTLKKGNHVFLTGLSRVGKSLTAKAFTEELKKGKFPELADKVVFRINTADIVKQKGSIFGGANSALKDMSERMGRHRKSIILVFDEMHMACKEGEPIADQMKTYLDENGDFPYVIGITTKEEFVKNVQGNTAFGLRFDEIEIQNMETFGALAVLAHKILGATEKPLVESGVLKKIYERSVELKKDAPQPKASLEILKKCMQKVSSKQESSTKRVLNRVIAQQKSWAAVNAAEHGNVEYDQALEKLKKEKKELKAKLEKENAELARLFKMKSILDLATSQVNATLMKTDFTAHNTLSDGNKKQVKLIFLLHEYFSGAVKHHLEDKTKDGDLHVIINSKLVNDVTATPKS